MGRIEKILAGTDFSPAGDLAVETAAAWARRHRAALRVVHVVPPKRWLVGAWQTDDSTVSAIHGHAAEALKARVDALDPERRLEVSTGVVSGAAAEVLATSALEFQADLLVVGVRGEHAESGGAPAVLGGSAMKLLATSPVPLLLSQRQPANAPASVLAAVNLSPGSREVVAVAAASLPENNGRLCIFHAYEAPFTARLENYGLARGAIALYTDAEEQKRRHDMEALAAESGADADTHIAIERGDPADALRRTLDDFEPDLIVLGHDDRRRGRSGVPGGLVRHVASLGRTDVLVVPPGAAQIEAKG